MMENLIWREGNEYRVSVIPNEYDITPRSVVELIATRNYHLMRGDTLTISLPNGEQFAFRVVPGPRLNPQRPPQHQELLRQFEASKIPPDIDEPNIEV